MKLVDILARELKVWPENNNGCDYCVQVFNQREVIFGNPENTIIVSEVTDDNHRGKVTRAQWQAAIDALKAEKAVEWNGDGLPPVGTVCEAQTSRGWSRGTIIAHGLPPKENLAVWQEDGELIFWGVKEYFRPIRTPEQIAYAEKVWNDERARIKGTEEIYAVLFGHGGASRADLARAIYDAGYRKFEIVDN